MWVSKKKWNELEKRVADLEEKVQSQPKAIVQHIAAQLNKRMTKSVPIRRH